MEFELQPTLAGELVTLRPLAEDDWDALYAVASDPLIWEQHPAHDRWRKAVFRAFFREAMESGGALAIIDRTDGRIIGASRFHGWDAGAREIEIGWTFLARSHWGGRYNGETKALMLAHAFRFADGAIFVIGPDNMRSRRAVEKVGGALAGHRRDDTGRQSVVYRIAAPSRG